MHYFDLGWLGRTVEALSGPGAAYHVARKAIPSKSGDKVGAGRLGGMGEGPRLLELGAPPHLDGCMNGAPASALALALNLPTPPPPPPQVPGVKLEMFIFDPFHTAKTTTLFEVGSLPSEGASQMPSASFDRSATPALVDPP
jgi:hypothetical protein